MPPAAYSYIDVAVLDAVRERFAAGDAIAILSVELSEIIWANGAGSLLFGYRDVEAAVGGDTGIGMSARRQIVSTRGFPQIGQNRPITVRLNQGMESRALGFLASTIRLPDGEDAIMLVLPLAGTRGSAIGNAREAIKGFTQPGHLVALLDGRGGIEAASDDFHSLGLSAQTLADLARDVAREPGRLIKKIVTGAGARYPAGIARLHDEPARLLLMVVDEVLATATPVEQQPDSSQETVDSQRGADDEVIIRAGAPADAAQLAMAWPDEQLERPIDAPAFEAAEHIGQLDFSEPQPPEIPIDPDAIAPADDRRTEEDAGTDTADHGIGSDQPVLVERSLVDEEGGSPATMASGHDPVDAFSAVVDTKARSDQSGAAVDDGPATSAQTPVEDGGAEFADGPDADGNASATDITVALAADVQGVEEGATSQTAPVRFVWKTDAEGRFSAISPEFVAAVGDSAGDVIGRTFTDVSAHLSLDPSGDIAGLLDRRDTWSGRSVLWPIAGTDIKVPVDLAALPVYSRTRTFEGFRGFGVARMNDAVMDPEAIGLRLVSDGKIEAFSAASVGLIDGLASTEPMDPFRGEAPALRVAEQPDRRFSDKIIKLAEHRLTPVERSLSPVEKVAFREIGDRLKKVEDSDRALDAPVEEEPSSSAVQAEPDRVVTRTPAPAMSDDAETIPVETGIERVVPGLDTVDERAREDEQLLLPGVPAKKLIEIAEGEHDAPAPDVLTPDLFKPGPPEIPDVRPDVYQPPDFEGWSDETPPLAEALEVAATSEAAEHEVETSEAATEPYPVAAIDDADALVVADDAQISAEPSDQPYEPSDFEGWSDETPPLAEALDVAATSEAAEHEAETSEAAAEPYPVAAIDDADAVVGADDAQISAEPSDQPYEPSDFEGWSDETPPLAEALDVAATSEAAEHEAETSEAATEPYPVAAIDDADALVVADDAQISAEPSDQPYEPSDFEGWSDETPPLAEALDVAATSEAAEHEVETSEAAAEPYPVANIDDADAIVAADDAQISAEAKPDVANATAGASDEPYQPSDFEGWSDETPPLAEALDVAATSEAAEHEVESHPAADMSEETTPDVARQRPQDTAILARLPVPILIHSGDLLHYANAEFLDLTGYPSVEALANAGGLDVLFADSYAEDDASEADRSLRLKSADGQEFAIDALLRAVPWEGARALMLVVRRSGEADTPLTPPLLEINERDELRARVAEMRTIIDTATDGVILIDKDGVIRSISRPAEALFGYESDDIEGKPFVSLFAMESQRAARDYLEGLSNNGVASVLNDGREVIGREFEGRFIPLFMSIGRLPNETGFCAVVRDLTQWKRAEEELTHARSLAERASSQKTDFLARISHEIRTPLNAIIGFSELMMDERFGSVGNERYRDYLRDINRSGNHVLDLVNDLLDISKIEAGEQEMAHEAVSLNETIGQSVAMMQPQANRERVIIRSSLASKLPDVVADLRSIRQISLNLLSNAIRYTQAGGQVIVSTSYEPTGEVVMRIRDTGIGMTPSEIEQALKPFKQINALKRTRGDGTGLGLPLTKAMVEANRARFAINSTPGEGTLVEVTFPSPRVLAH